MVHVEKDFKNPPAALIDSKWDDLKKDVLINQGHKAQSKCYRNTTLEALVKLYSNKCACCERSRGTELQVDHYRPKKPRKKGNMVYRHSGYYWLTYEWSNLIPLCSSCNQSKSNYFLIKNNSRITSHKYSNGKLNKNVFNPHKLHQKEMPLFINPEIELQPAKHFKYLPNGEVQGRTDEGQITVEFYKLNNRNKKRERREIIKAYIIEIRNAIHEYYISTNENKNIELYGDLKNVFRRILENGKKTEPFSLMHIYIRNYFNEFITRQLPVQMQARLNEYFTSYKHNWKNS